MLASKAVAQLQLRKKRPNAWGLREYTEHFHGPDHVVLNSCYPLLFLYCCFPTFNRENALEETEGETKAVSAQHDVALFHRACACAFLFRGYVSRFACSPLALSFFMGRCSRRSLLVARALVCTHQPEEGNRTLHLMHAHDAFFPYPNIKHSWRCWQTVHLPLPGPPSSNWRLSLRIPAGAPGLCLCVREKR